MMPESEFRLETEENLDDRMETRYTQNPSKGNEAFPVSAAPEKHADYSSNHQAPVVFFISHWPYVEISSKS